MLKNLKVLLTQQEKRSKLIWLKSNFFSMSRSNVWVIAPFIFKTKTNFDAFNFFQTFFVIFFAEKKKFEKTFFMRNQVWKCEKILIFLRPLSLSLACTMPNSVSYEIHHHQFSRIFELYVVRKREKNVQI